MKYSLFSVFIFHSSICLSQLADDEIHDLKMGRVDNDTTYVYWLPYESGNRFLLVQASNSKFSHKNELSADFKMKPGTLICAAREGVVIDLRDDSDSGGLKEENLGDGNYVVIQHSDGSIASYWHLQKDGALVKLGDNVKKGQAIARSGNTGYSAFPHLHFQVVDKDGKQILTRFYTKKGARYLRPGKWYRAVHN